MILFFIVTSTDENDSECQDEDMMSQHNHSAYSLVLIDGVEGLSSEEGDNKTNNVKNNSPNINHYKEKSFESQTIKEENQQSPLNNSNEADDTITNVQSLIEPTTSPDSVSPKKSDEMLEGDTPRSNQFSETTNSTPRSAVRRSGAGGCYSFRALPQTPSGTPRGMRAYIRSHTFPRGSKGQEEEDEYWDQVKIFL